MELVVETTIATTPERAFDAMADVRNETRWNPQVSRAELVSDEPVREGSQFVTVNRGYEYRATISTYDRPQRLTFAVTGRVMDMTPRFEFVAEGDRTRLRGTFEIRPKGVMRGLVPLLRPVVARDLAKQARGFAAMCEADAARV